MMRKRSRRQSSAKPAVTCGNRKQQGDDRGRQGIHRHHVPDSHGREQRHQQDAGKQLLAARRGRSVARSDNLTAVQEGHRILIRELKIVVGNITYPVIQSG